MIGKRKPNMTKSSLDMMEKAHGVTKTHERACMMVSFGLNGAIANHFEGWCVFIFAGTNQY
jgi:hypothetical protein